MNTAKLFHNPKAGDEEHEKEEIVNAVKMAGFECRYSSTKGTTWKAIEDDVDFVIVAGGDGTVRKITKELLKRKMLDKTLPIAVLPLGTANNISKTLHLNDSISENIKWWKQAKIQLYDVGKINQVSDASFFLESFGFGLFPWLMEEMKTVDKSQTDTPEKKLTAALKVLHRLTLQSECQPCQLIIDGKDHSGNFLLVELMNTKSIGPNIFLAPNADPGDGKMEVVMLNEKDKDNFAAYLQKKLQGSEETYDFSALKASEVKISWQNKHVHADDEVIKVKPGAEVILEVKPGLLHFMVPQ